VHRVSPEAPEEHRETGNGQVLLLVIVRCSNDMLRQVARHRREA